MTRVAALVTRQQDCRQLQMEIGYVLLIVNGRGFLKPNMKTWLIGVCLILFIISHTTFTYFLKHVPMLYSTKNLWRGYSYSFILMTTYIFQKIGLKNYLQSQLIEVTFFVVIFTFIITILTNNFIILNPYHLMEVVDIGTGIVTIIILISAQRHGFMQN